MNVKYPLGEPMSPMLEEKQASPDLQKFFMNLLDLKLYIRYKYEESKNESIKDILDRLEAIIKEKK